ncbi:MAG: hypothetical protein M4579_003106 [Chaenotheca gracillima]|nr:MAG: hypothetical protein M4579_003106 [Chaenotheca gracillima]
MSLAQPTGTAPPPAALNLSNLSSNNPFRNRAASPSSFQSEPSPLPQASPSINSRPASRNPFLDNFDAAVDDNNKPLLSPTSPQRKNGVGARPAQQSTPNDLSFDFFEGMNLNEQRPKRTGRCPPILPCVDYEDESLTALTENPSVPGPSQRSAAASGIAHRPSRSQEQDAPDRPRGPPPPYGAIRPSRRADVFADPIDPTTRRPRRNSDSSVRSSKLIDVEDDRRRRERRPHRDGRPREGTEGRTSSKTKKTSRRLDLIDKLDVTSIYGTGLFHHDGPFDACNPHRNRKGSSRAPMQAFPKDSANNAMGGSGPVNKDIDRAQYFGNRGVEAFADYATSGKDSAVYEPYPTDAPRPKTVRSTSFNPTERIEPVHGDLSLGLGTSTFLEGAPASRTAMARRESQDDGVKAAGGLQRKMSLAQKIRGMNSVRQPNRAGRVTSPDSEPGIARTTSTSPKQDKPSGNSASAGGVTTLTDSNNPFFSDYDTAYDKKGETIAVAAQEKDGRARAPSSPRRGLERRITHDAASSSVGVGSEENKPTGFLSRVKSLKGGRRPRPAERGL